MKRPIQLIIAIVAFLFLMPSLSKAQSEKIEGDFIHVVFFWLKNPDSQEDRNKFEASLKKFINSSEYITGKHVGMPADTDRPVIDNSYTYSLILTFENKEMQDKYQEEPAHKLFIKESESLWQKVLVYDSENML